jgi:hypothetical protein
MEGLRTTLPGVQVLFAFLLVLPLQAEFGGITDIEKVAYYIAFFGSAMASVLLIAPSAHQRLRAPISGLERRSERHLAVAVNLTIAGTIIFSIALAAAVFLISSLTLTNSLAVAATIAVAALTAWSWFYIPLVAFRRS